MDMSLDQIIAMGRMDVNQCESQLRQRVQELEQQQQELTEQLRVVDVEVERLQYVLSNIDRIRPGMVSSEYVGSHHFYDDHCRLIPALPPREYLKIGMRNYIPVSDLEEDLSQFNKELVDNIMSCPSDIRLQFIRHVCKQLRQHPDLMDYYAECNPRDVIPGRTREQLDAELDAYMQGGQVVNYPLDWLLVGC